MVYDIDWPDFARVPDYVFEYQPQARLVTLERGPQISAAGANAARIALEAAGLTVAAAGVGALLYGAASAAPAFLEWLLFVLAPAGA